MAKKIFVFALSAVFLALCFSSEAQQPAKIPRIGILIPPPRPAFRPGEAFRQRLRELGYVEGKNIVIEYRYAEGKLERLPVFAAELVGLKVDVIVAVSQAIQLLRRRARQFRS